MSDKLLFTAAPEAALTMSDQYKTHRGKLVRAISATGVRGCLIRSSADGAWYFRVYKSDGKSIFEDYKLSHLDLEVTVNDQCAAFYSDEEGNRWLDYDPQRYAYSPLDEVAT